MQPPGVGGITADFRGPIKRWSRLGAVVGLSFEVRLLAAEFVAERSGRRRPGPAGVFPLRLRREPELPIPGQFAGLPAKFGELPAERLRLGKVDVADGKVVPLGQLRREWTRQLAHDSLPLPLGRLVLGHPKTLGQRHLDLIFVGTTLHFVVRAAHDELAWWAPAKLDASGLTMVSSLRALEGGRRSRPG